MSIRYKFIQLLVLTVGIVIMVNATSCRRTINESSPIKNTEGITLPDPADFDLEKIKERGSLIAIVENSSTGFFIYKGQPMGYEYDLLELFSKHIGVSLEIKITSSIQEAFEMLNKGEGDIIAYSLTVTKERKKEMAFTDSHYTTRQVLIQQKPQNWHKLTRDEINKRLIRNQVDLIGKEIHVRKKVSLHRSAL